MKASPRMLEEIAAQEQRLVFDAFAHNDAWALGSLMVSLARERNLPIAMRIERSGQILFACALEGSTPDNDEWIARKNRVVQRFKKSSLALAVSLALEGKDLEERFAISLEYYAPNGGAFPLIVKGAGVIGSVTVSGLPQEEDHAFVVECLDRFLHRKT